MFETETWYLLFSRISLLVPAHGVYNITCYTLPNRHSQGIKFKDWYEYSRRAEVTCSNGEKYSIDYIQVKVPTPTFKPYMSQKAMLSSFFFILSLISILVCVIRGVYMVKGRDKSMIEFFFRLWKLIPFDIFY